MIKYDLNRNKSNKSHVGLRVLVDAIAYVTCVAWRWRPREHTIGQYFLLSGLAFLRVQYPKFVVRDQLRGIQVNTWSQTQGVREQGNVPLVLMLLSHGNGFDTDWSVFANCWDQCSYVLLVHLQEGLPDILEALLWRRHEFGPKLEARERKRYDVSDRYFLCGKRWRGTGG